MGRGGQLFARKFDKMIQLPTELDTHTPRHFCQSGLDYGGQRFRNAPLWRGISWFWNWFSRFPGSNAFASVRVPFRTGHVAAEAFFCRLGHFLEDPGESARADIAFSWCNKSVGGLH
ncbi:hypothetical protein BRX37_10245 [Sphingomonas sp. S-NIH.Pt3_0716]|nr:hypothetical protein BRX37_10245 [Sphingomonas sp. S-NIH.Pt3_0716]